MSGVEYMEFEDINIVAYLHYRGYKFVPYKKSEDRVGFKIYGNDIEKTLADMYMDYDIQLYLKSQKAVRNSLFTTKSENIKEATS